MKFFLRTGINGSAGRCALTERVYSSRVFLCSRGGLAWSASGGLVCWAVRQILPTRIVTMGITILILRRIPSSRFGGISTRTPDNTGRISFERHADALIDLKVY